MFCSLHEQSELLQWLCHDDSTINIVLVIVIIIIIIIIIVVIIIDVSKKESDNITVKLLKVLL